VKAALLTEAQARTLRKLVARYKKEVRPWKSWKRRTPDELWRKVLTQVIVVGNAGPGYLLERSVEAKRQVSLARLKSFRNDRAAVKRHLHRILLALGTRYVGKSWRKDRKAHAAAQNYLALVTSGGPKRFFTKVAAQRTEKERLQFLTERLRYYGDKGARDTLIELHLASNCMALDVRIAGLLRRLGAKVSESLGRDYEEVEKELIHRIAVPCHLTGAELDRILFQNYDAILADLKLTS
jgi:hypothetical protein